MKKYRDFTELELKWINSFERVMKKAPNTLFLFAAGGINILTLDKNGNRYIGENRSMDQMGPLITIETKMQVDGGDW